ncbi:MAG TPA: hypothetical protein VMV27_07710 [Candidatus Binataceae bacterium]|nr:hypothetical protein [Candidatus Binataceae bacterium]
MISEILDLIAALYRVFRYTIAAAILIPASLIIIVGAVLMYASRQIDTGPHTELLSAIETTKE